MWVSRVSGSPPISVIRQLTVLPPYVVCLPNQTFVQARASLLSLIRSTAHGTALSTAHWDVSALVRTQRGGVWPGKRKSGSESPQPAHMDVRRGVCPMTGATSGTSPTRLVSRDDAPRLTSHMSTCPTHLPICCESPSTAPLSTRRSSSPLARVRSAARSASQLLASLTAACRVRAPRCTRTRPARRGPLPSSPTTRRSGASAGLASLRGNRPR